MIFVIMLDTYKVIRNHTLIITLYEFVYIGCISFYSGDSDYQDFQNILDKFKK